jgi:CheY-like chemotaxis protein
MQDLPIESPAFPNLEPVLVVEDNRLNQKVAILLLERLGMQAEVANNGLEAIQAVTQQRYSIILMDCHMPEMDGFEATVAIRNIEAASGAYTPIIAVTALTTSADRQRCLESGMDDYIAKPIEKERLKAKIDQWLLTAMALHNPGSAAMFRSSIAASEHLPFDEDAVNFQELKEFYGENQLSQMLQAFMSETAKKLTQLDNFVKAQNGTAVSILALELKASCAAIGAKQLATLCLYQQIAAASADWPEAQETCTSLQRSFAYGRHLFQSGIMTEENSPIDDADLLATGAELNGNAAKQRGFPHSLPRKYN